MTTILEGPRLFAVITEDRHTDVAVEVYRTEAEAVLAAKHIYASEVEGHIEGDIWEDRTAEHYETESPGVVSIEGRPFHAYYSTEGDCVYVREVELIGDDPRRHVVEVCNECPVHDDELDYCKHPDGDDRFLGLGSNAPPPTDCPLRKQALLLEVKP